MLFAFVVSGSTYARRLNRWRPPTYGRKNGPQAIFGPGGCFSQAAGAPCCLIIPPRPEKNQGQRRVLRTLDFFRPGRCVRSSAAPHRPPAGKSVISRKCEVAGASHLRKTNKGGRSNKAGGKVLFPPEVSARLCCLKKRPAPPCSFSPKDFIKCRFISQWSR